ncbi:MAG: class III extradiol ring-cleavage dioxygenase [Sphingomicrobium sp.]
MKFDPLFVSHGSPMLALEQGPAAHFLRQLGRELPRPRAILVGSAHWETEVPTVNSVTTNETIYDFRGFPAELSALRYPAPGAPTLAARVAELLTEARFPVMVDERRGLDHGAWVPLILGWPDADVPVIELSVQTQLGPEHHLRIGKALRPLADEGVLILGSGSFTHDLSSWRLGRDEPDWVSEFAQWMDEAIAGERIDDLLNYRRLAPFAARNHPTEEHLLPLFVALGAAASAAQAKRIHSSVEHGVLRMDAYRFGVPDGQSQMR